MTQQFHKGDMVRIAKNLGESMSHFRSDCEAIVIGSYADQYGGDDREIYTLHLKGGGKCSWYHEHQLALIESGRLDKLQAWEEAADAEHKQASDLDWIFANGPEIANEPHGATVAALARCLGCNNLWGNHGEGFVWAQNAAATMSHAKPFLLTKDKAGWLVYAEAVAETMRKR